MTNEEVIKCADCILSKGSFLDRQTMINLLGVAKLQERELELCEERKTKLEEENNRLKDMVAVDYSLSELIKKINEVIAEAITYGDRGELSDISTEMEQLLSLIDKEKKYCIAIQRCNYRPFYVGRQYIEDDK